MRLALYFVGGPVLVVIAAFAAIIAFYTPSQTPPLASINNPYAAIDFSDLPLQQEYRARDGTRLTYRLYPNKSDQIAVLLHGSPGGRSTNMHPLAKALRDAGASVYVPDLRGHAGLGRSGDIDYIGQLEDDLADLVAPLRQAHPRASIALIGFSASGGFVLRVIGGAYENLFDRFIMISPDLPGAPTIRPQKWVSLYLPRTIVLTILDRASIDGFDGFWVLGLDTSPQADGLTTDFDTFRMTIDLDAPPDYLARLARSTKPVAVLVGGADGLYFPDRFAPLLQPVRPDLRITIVPAVDHVGMTVAPEGIAAVKEAYLDLRPRDERK